MWVVSMALWCLVHGHWFSSLPGTLVPAWHMVSFQLELQDLISLYLLIGSSQVGHFDLSRCVKLPWIGCSSGTWASDFIYVELTCNFPKTETSKGSERPLSGVTSITCGPGTLPSWRLLRFAPSHRNPKRAQTGHRQRWICDPAAFVDETKVGQRGISTADSKSCPLQHCHSPARPSIKPKVEWLFKKIVATLKQMRKIKIKTLCSKLFKGFSNSLLSEQACAVDWHQEEICFFRVQGPAGRTFKVTMKKDFCSPLAQGAV